MVAWIPLMMGAQAGLGYLQGRANQKRQRALDRGRQAEIKYSWASGLQPSGPQDAGPGGLASAAQGAITGAQMGMALDKGLSDKPNPTQTPDTGSSQNGQLLGVGYNTGSFNNMAQNLPGMPQQPPSPVAGGMPQQGNLLSVSNAATQNPNAMLGTNYNASKWQNLGRF